MSTTHISMSPVGTTDRRVRLGDTVVLRWHDDDAGPEPLVLDYPSKSSGAVVSPDSVLGQILLGSPVTSTIVYEVGGLVQQVDVIEVRPAAARR